MLANIVPLFDISLKGDTRNALILNAAIALSEYGDAVTLLIAERFLEVSDHWRSDDSLIATGLIFLSLAGRTGFGSAIAPEIMAQRADQPSGSFGTAELRRFDYDPRVVWPSRPSTALHAVFGGGRKQQRTLRWRTDRFLAAACGRSIAAGVIYAEPPATGVLEKAERS